jgi:acetylornithine deacetylase/succinyl-diaminopimelate desuccinylase-like protein
MAHLDVVGVKGQDWTMPPLEAQEKDAYLYGRGAIDDKSMAVLGVQMLRLLKRTGAPLKRDVVLALTADEESSAKFGLGWILKNHPDAVKADFAFNEGGQIILENGKVRYVEVQTAEKVYLDLRLETTGVSGHSSVPVPDNAIYRLARALQKLADKQFPIQLNETTRTMFAGLVQAGGPEAPALKQLLAGGAAGARAGKKLASLPHFNSVLRTTFVPTMLEGGTRVNVLPSGASANINCRVLPGMDVRQAIRQIEAWIGDPRVKVAYAEEDLETAQASPVAHPVFEAIRKVSKEHFPGAIVMPMMSPGATDSRFLRLKGIPAYGLLPFPMTRDDDHRMHAADERLPLASIEPALKFTHALVLEVCR